MSIQPPQGTLTIPNATLRVGQLHADAIVGFDMAVTSNLEVGQANLFVDTLNTRVGIGKTEPGYALDVVGDINFTGDLYEGGTLFVSTPWNIETSPDALSYTAGNVGIGTINPSSPLHVKGEVGISEGSISQFGSTLDNDTYSALISPDGSRIVTYTPGGSLNFYALLNGTYTLVGYASYYSSFALFGMTFDGSKVYFYDDMMMTDVGFFSPSLEGTASTPVEETYFYYGLGYNPQYAAFSSDGSRAVVEEYGLTTVYDSVNSSPSQVGQTINGGGGSGVDISSDGSRIVLLENNNTRIYELVNGIWTQVGQTINGSHVSISSDGSSVAVRDSGQVKVYNLVNGTWTQVGQTINGSHASITFDGSRIAVGDSTNVQVKVYDLVNGTWTQVGPTINGTSGSLTHDGSRLLVENSTNGPVTVYDIVDPTYSPPALLVEGTVKATAFEGDGSALTGITSGQWTESSGNIYRSSGNVGIGLADPNYPLHVSGDIYATGNVTAYSDKRKKTNLRIISDALDKVSNLNGYTYEKDGTKYTGLIAQEVLKVLPEAVVGNEEDGYGLAYGNMVGILVEAIKELTNEVKNLKEKLSS